MDAIDPRIQEAMKIVINKAYRSGFNDGLQFVVDSLRDAADSSTVDVYAAIQRELANMFESAKLKITEEPPEEVTTIEESKGDVTDGEQHDGQEGNG